MSPRFSHVKSLPKQAFLFCPESVFFKSLTAVILETYIYQEQDNRGLAEGLLFQTEEKQNKIVRGTREISVLFDTGSLCVLYHPHSLSSSFLSREIKIKYTHGKYYLLG